MGCVEYIRGYGPVRLGELAPVFKNEYFRTRMLNISQLGAAVTNKFIDANHSRYSHLIGSFNLADNMANYLIMQDGNYTRQEAEYEKKLLKLVAGIHDGGHFPSSHILERVLKGLGLIGSHDENHAFLKYLKTDIEKCGIVYEDVLRKFNEKDPLIWSLLGVDKMDYIVRDLTGAGFNTSVNPNMLINSLVYTNGDLGGHVEDLILFDKYINDYWTAHKMIYMNLEVQLNEWFLSRAIAKLIDEKSLGIKDFNEMNDRDLETLLLSSNGVSKIISNSVFKGVPAKPTSVLLIYEKPSIEDANYIIRGDKHCLFLPTESFEGLTKHFETTSNVITFMEDLETEYAIKEGYVVFSPMHTAGRLKTEGKNINLYNNGEVVTTLFDKSDFLEEKLITDARKSTVLQVGALYGGVKKIEANIDQVIDWLVTIA